MTARKTKGARKTRAGTASGKRQEGASTGLPPGKRGRPRKDTKSAGSRDAILAAATAVFSELGFHGASIDAVCSRAGFTKPSLYHHFDSKEALMAAVLNEIGGQWLNKMELPAAIERADDRQQLDEMMRRWTKLVRNERALLRLPIIGAIELAGDSPVIRTAVEQIWSDAEDAIVDGLERSLGTTVPDPRPLASAVVALLQAAAMRYHVDNDLRRLRRNLEETRAVVVLLAKSRFDPGLSRAQ
jgi:AcrR family transcriptional regulator